MNMRSLSNGNAEYYNILKSDIRTNSKFKYLRGVHAYCNIPILSDSVMEDTEVRRLRYYNLYHCVKFQYRGTRLLRFKDLNLLQRERRKSKNR